MGGGAVAWQRRVAGRGRCWRGRLTGRTGRQRGPVGQRLGVGGSEREQGSAVIGADRWARQHSAGQPGFKSDSNRIQLFKTVQTDLKLTKLWLTQKCFLVLQKWEIKYGWKELEMRNNFVYKRFPRIWNRYWTKIQKSFYDLNFNRNSLEILRTLEFDKIWPTSSSLFLVSRKNEFQAKMDQGFEFLLKVEFGLILQ
jgi:hypothetical protein